MRRKAGFVQSGNHKVYRRGGQIGSDPRLSQADLVDCHSLNRGQGLSHATHAGAAVHSIDTQCEFRHHFHPLSLMICRVKGCKAAAETCLAGSHIRRDKTARDVGHPGFVVSHPFHDKTVERMGHPGFVHSHICRDKTAADMGHPAPGARYPATASSPWRPFSPLRAWQPSLLSQIWRLSSALQTWMLFCQPA